MIPRDTDDAVDGRPPYASNVLVRAQRARQLLHDGEPIKEICLAMGFVLYRLRHDNGATQWSAYGGHDASVWAGSWTSMTDVEEWLLSGCPERRAA